MDPRSVSGLVLAVLLGGGGGCAGPSEPGPQRLRPATPDKQSLWGDASLLPTRAGERARRELAHAGALERALTQLGMSSVYVDVELRDVPEVVIIAQAPTRPTPALQEDRIEATIAELSAALIPALHRDQLHLWISPSLVDPPAPGPSSSHTRDPWIWAMMLTCIGLGASLGVLGERLRIRRSAAARAAMVKSR